MRFNEGGKHLLNRGMVGHIGGMLFSLHAQAQHIWVRLKTQRDVLALEVQDDGVGFNVGAVNANYEKRGSLGMVNMRERAEILEGAVKIDSEEGKGTRITVLVPLTEAAALRVRS